MNLLYSDSADWVGYRQQEHIGELLLSLRLSAGLYCLCVGAQVTGVLEKLVEFAEEKMDDASSLLQIIVTR